MPMAAHTWTAIRPHRANRADSSDTKGAGQSRAPAAPVTASHFSLPDQGYDLAAILEQPKAKVRKTLGEPARSFAAGEPAGGADARDEFTPTAGLTLLVGYDARGRGKWLTIEMAGVGANVPQARIWLKQTPAGSISIRGQEITVDASADSDAVTFTDARYGRELDAATDKLGRQVLAQEYERNLLDQGLNATVRAHGAGAKVLTVEWPLCSKAALYSLTKGSGANGEPVDASAFVWTLHEAGFKKIECTDGYEATYSISWDK